MAVDDRDESGAGGAQGPDAGGPVGDAADAGAPAPPPRPARARRRYITRRNALLVALVAAVGALVLVLLGVFMYRTGRVDALIADQIVGTLARYGIRAQIREFHTKLGPRTAEIKGLDLYDAQTGAQLGRVDTLIATVRVEDLYALKFSRNVNLEALDINGAELWVAFDEDGRSNFSHLHLPPPRENERILFSYSTARVTVQNARVHYEVRRRSTDDQTGEVTHHTLAGEARNLRLTVEPDDPAAPAESRMNKVALAMSGSTFALDGNTVEPIDVEAHARVNQTRAEISDLTLRSPVAESRLQGTLDDWRAGRYQLQVRSTVDLTQVSDIFKTPTPLRGAGEFVGTIKGEGTRYRVEGDVKSDALAAGDVRLKGLQVNVTADGDGAEQYNAQGRAVAELLTAGSFNLNLLQVRGGVMGSGTDFRFVGELRAAAARSGANTIAGLMLADAVAESRDGQLSGSASSASATAVTASGVRINGAQARDLRFSGADADNFNGSAASVTAGTITAQDTRVNGVTATGITAAGRGGVTNVTVNGVRVGGGQIAGAQVGSINIAGVRLAIHDGGRVEGSTGDINAGTVAFAQGQVKGRADNVRLARPVFTVEPSGRYRASMDLSLGGGLLGDFQLGAARAAVVATNNEVQLRNFSADALGGHARGNATINTARGPSRVNADFENLDIGGLLALLTGRAVPVTGATTGTAALTFPGTNAQLASGTLNAQLTGEAGNEDSGRTPVTGTLALTADRGTFQISRADLQAGASQLTATGRFSFGGDSDLQVRVNSADAGELQRVVVATGLIPGLEERLGDYGVALAGQLTFDGTVRGRLEDPIINGRTAVGSLRVNGRDLGALTATIQTDANAINIPDGRLAQPDGGSLQFALNVPRAGENNITLDATLDRVDIGNLIGALPSFGSAQPDDDTAGNVLAANAQAISAAGPAFGKVHVTGIPGALNGTAELRAGPGVIRNEPFDEIAVRATFAGQTVNLETLNARFRGGALNASGNVDLESKRFDLRAQGQNVPLDLLTDLAGLRAANLAGTADFKATATGDYSDPRSFQVNLDGTGRDVTVNGQRAGTLAITGRTEGQRFNLQLTTGILGQPQVITASVDLSKEELPTIIDTTLTNVDLTQLFATLVPNADVRVTGRATGTLHAEGNLYGDEGFTADALRGTARFTQLTVQVQDVQLSAVDPLVVTFTPNEVTFDRTQFVGPGTNVTFGGTAALAAGGRQNFTVDGDLNLRVLNSLSRNVFLAGAARVGVRVGGSFAQPQITGTAAVNGATFSVLVEDERLTVSQINGEVRFTADRAQIDSLTGRLGGGTLSVTGGAALAGFSLAQFRLSLHGDQITVPFPQDFRSTADADLILQGDLQRQLLRGTVNLRRAEYTQDIELADLINRRPETTITEGGGAGFAGVTLLDLSVEGRDALVVRNNIADMVGSVALQIRGTADDPVIGGRITATRGTLSFRNDRYELTRAFIDLPPQRDADPLLNIQAESEIKGYQVIVNLTGPLSSPSASVRSEPALPQADVVALITTGSLSGGDTGTSTLAQTGLGTATSLLTDAIINAPVQRATDKLFGLNRFEIDPLIAGRGGASPTARLTVGRQINRNLSLTYSTNVTTEQNQVVALEYRVSDRLSFVAQYQQGAVNTLRTQNNNFSFEIRFRKRF
ncbi:MAG TPA: translocation/assembly module TamB domain-containing protein [Pyrinomonadaceae bacterium]|jgi:translocation and assembly module TamB